MLETDYKNSAVSRRHVSDWFIRFTAGYEDREDYLGVKCRLLEI